MRNPSLSRFETLRAERGTTMSTTMIEPVIETPAPQEQPPVKRPSPVRKSLRMARTVIVLLVLLAVAAAGGNYIVRQRIAERAFVNAGPAVLTAEPIDV